MYTQYIMLCVSNVKLNVTVEPGLREREGERERESLHNKSFRMTTNELETIFQGENFPAKLFKECFDDKFYTANLCMQKSPDISRQICFSMC